MSKSLSCWGWTAKRIVKNRQVVLLWGKKCLLVPQREWSGAAAWRDFGISLMILEMEWKRGSVTCQSNRI